MQDIHTIGGGGARFFGGGGGDRRLRPNNQHNNIQALKCPRCESINTKFCYYNNYNLSQPRHFCKSCRRYWTKGGVLRNVPVGGGCRKSKRSKPKSNTTTTTAAADVVDGSEEPKSNSHSSSESSSLTATTTAAATNNTGTGTTSSTAAAAAEVVSASSSNVSSSMFLNFSESNFFVPNSTNNTFDHHHHHQHHHQPTLIDHTTEGDMFQDIGNFTSLIPPSNDPRSFNIAEIPGWNHQESKMNMETDHVKMEQMNNGSGFMSQTSRVELSGLQQNKVNNNSELCSSLDWQIGGGTGEHGLYDLTGTVDQTYWSQTQWGENDQSLNFLP